MVALVLVALSVAACGGDDGGGKKPGPPPQPKDSMLYDIPLHESAVLEGAKSGPGRETYRVGLPVLGLANFYMLVARMGDDMPFRDLEWCRGSRTGEPLQAFERVWRKPATNDFLVLQGTADGKGSQLVIIDEKANATRTC